MSGRVVEREPGWGRTAPLLDRDPPLFWLAVALLLAGASFVQAVVGLASVVRPGPASLMVVGWTVYALPFVVLIVLLDLHEPEPPPLLAAAFAWGALVAVPIANIANSSILSILRKRLDDDAVTRWYPALSGPWTEELLKGLGLLVLVTLARRQVTSVLDGIVYGAFIGLGFQVGENLVYTADSLQGAFVPNGGRFVVDVLIQRGLGIGLWSHAAYTAIVGAGVGYALSSGIRRRRAVAAVVGAVVIAGALHFAWNAPWWQPAPYRFDLQTMTTYLAKGLPALALVTALALAARAREVSWFTGALVGRPGVTDEDLQSLRSWKGRRRARSSARATGGRRARLAVRALQSAQVRLAVAVALDRDPADVDAASRRVAGLRRALDDSLDEPLDEPWEGGAGSGDGRRP